MPTPANRATGRAVACSNLLQGQQNKQRSGQWGQRECRAAKTVHAGQFSCLEGFWLHATAASLRRRCAIATMSSLQALLQAQSRQHGSDRRRQRLRRTADAHAKGFCQGVRSWLKMPATPQLPVQGRARKPGREP